MSVALRGSADFRRRLVATFAHWAFADAWQLRVRTLDRMGLRGWQHPACPGQRRDPRQRQEQP